MRVVSAARQHQALPTAGRQALAFIVVGGDQEALRRAYLADDGGIVARVGIIWILLDVGQIVTAWPYPNFPAGQILKYPTAMAKLRFLEALQLLALSCNVARQLQRLV